MADLISRLAASGHPLSHTQVREMAEENILWSNVYNADELGFGIGHKRTTHIIVDVSHGVKQAYQAEPGRQEWGYSDGVYLCRRKFYFTDDYF